MIGMLLSLIAFGLSFLSIYQALEPTRKVKRKKNYLKSLGIEWDEKLQWEIFNYSPTDVEKRQISILAFLDEDEFRILNHKIIFPKAWNTIGSYECYVEEKDIDSAFELRKEIRFLMTLYQAIKEIKEREKFEALSEAGRETLNHYKKEAEDLEQALMKWIRIDGEQLTFSNAFFLSEDKYLNKLKEKVESARPGNEPLNELPTPKIHPVLIEMTEFLDSNDLPKENVIELRQTMEKIQKQLKETEQEKVSSHAILEAKAINKTAKQFFNIND